MAFNRNWIITNEQKNNVDIFKQLTIFHAMQKHKHTHTNILWYWNWYRNMLINPVNSSHKSHKLSVNNIKN